MRIIALMNQKGGVGKTTTTVNLGAALAEQGQRVCMIDMDPQAHLTINYGIDPSPEKPSLYNVLVEDAPLASAIHNAGERIDIIPSSIDLAAAEVELVSVIGRETLLKNAITAANVDYDFVLLDCPPSLGILTINALSAADEVIIPMQPQFLALQGVAKLLETVQLVNKRMNPRLKVTGIALTMYDSQAKLSGEVVNELSSFIESATGKNLPWSSAKIFTSRVRRNIKLAECPSFGQTILQYDSTSNGAADYRSLAAEVVEMTAPALVVTVNKEMNPAELAAARPNAEPAETQLVQS
jgi:chromosome partitioning protein